MNVLFYISAAVAVVGSLMMVTRRNAMHGLVNLIVAFLAIACAFWTLGAPFAAVLQIVVYAGAILVLFVFAVMILNIRSDSTPRSSALEWVIPGALAAILLAEIIFVLAGVIESDSSTAHAVVGPVQVGSSLFTIYALGVEAASIMLLAGLAGAFHFGMFANQEASDE